MVYYLTSTNLFQNSKFYVKCNISIILSRVFIKHYWFVFNSFAKYKKLWALTTIKEPNSPHTIQLFQRYIHLHGNWIWKIVIALLKTVNKRIYHTRKSKQLCIWRNVKGFTREDVKITVQQKTSNVCVKNNCNNHYILLCRNTKAV